MKFTPTASQNPPSPAPKAGAGQSFGMPRWSRAELILIEQEMAAKNFALPHQKINSLPQSKGDEGPVGHEIQRYLRESRKSVAAFWSHPAYLGSLAAMVSVVKAKSGDKRFAGVLTDPYYKPYAEALTRMTQDAKGSSQDEARFHRELCDIYNKSLKIAKESDGKYGTDFVSTKGVLGRKDKYEKVTLPPVPFSLSEHRDRHVLTVDREGNKIIKEAERMGFRESLSFFMKQVNKGSDAEERIGIAIGVALRMTWNSFRGKPYLNSLSRDQVARIAVTTQMANAARMTTSAATPAPNLSPSGAQQAGTVPLRLAESLPLPPPDQASPAPAQKAPEVKQPTKYSP